MTNGFPNGTPRPTYFLHAAGATRNNTWYVGDAGLTFTLSQPDGHAVTATGYMVRDFYGTVTSTGTFASGTTNLVLADPAGGWKPGWYRLYLTGPVTGAAVYGDSYGATNFQVIRPNANFPTMPVKSAANGTNLSAPVDAILRGVCGIGPNRYSINSVASPASDIADIQNCLAIEANYYTNPAYQDTARPRDLLVSFPNGAYDVVGIGGLRVFAKIPGTANLYIQVATGSVSGFKVTVATPNSATVVETYDNCADVPAVIAASSGSTRVVFAGVGSTGVGGPFAIPTTAYNGVVQVVQALYPSVKWFEGPSNEPGEDGSATTAQQMRVFQAAVKAGNGSAKALGPCHVSESFGATAMANFLAHNGGTYCDGLSYHAYNMCMGDPNIGKAAYDAFAAVLTAYSSQTSGKPIWQTEQGNFTPVFGTYHPRKARWQMLQLLIQEQYGIPRERNHMWYDMSHGFWSQPTWLENGDTSPNPQVTLTRVMAEELFGRTFESAVNFGEPGKRIFVGSSYLNSTDSTRTLALIAGSPLDNPAVTFTLAGVATTVAIVDAFGNTTQVNSGSGRFTVNIPDVPVYVRLPAGVTASVYQVAGWPLAATARVNLAGPNLYGAALTAGTLRTNWQALTSIVSGVWQLAGYNYNNAFQSSVTAMPDTVKLQWPTHPVTVDRVVIWSGFVYQAQCPLVSFDVQTSTDGSTWTTQATVDKSAVATSFPWGTDDQGTGTTADTFWPEQWIFDVPLPAPVRTSWLRVLVHQTGFGGAPDATAITAGDQADDGSQRVTISQLAVYSDDSLISRYATLT